VNCVVPVSADNPSAYNLVLVSSHKGSPLNKGRPLVLQSGTVSWVLNGQPGVYHPLSPVN